MNLNVLFLAGSAVFHLFLFPAPGGQKVAFVVGNDEYPSVPLENAVSDATAVRKMLRDELKFEEASIHFATNTSRIGFHEAFGRFTEAAKDAEIVLFYYAGHGMESIDGHENFLLPVDADVKQAIRSEAMLRATGINLITICSDLARKSKGAKIILMDACRERPQGRTAAPGSGGGLAVYEDRRIPSDTLIMLAAAPSRVASDGENHGPFTEALLEVLPREGQDLMSAFFAVSDRVQEKTRNQQIPWLKFDGSGQIFRSRQFLSATKPFTGEMRVVPDQFPTIQKAVDAAKSGDVVLVKPGIYNEVIVIGKDDIEIRGTDRQLCFVRYPKGYPREEGDLILIDGARSVTISNLTCEWPTGGVGTPRPEKVGDDMITVLNKGAATVVGCDLLGRGELEGGFVSVEGQLEARDCTVDGFFQGGLLSGSGALGRFTDCVFGEVDRGLEIIGGARGVVEGCLLKRPEREATEREGADAKGMTTAFLCQGRLRVKDCDVEGFENGTTVYREGDLVKVDEDSRGDFEGCNFKVTKLGVLTQPGVKVSMADCIFRGPGKSVRSNGLHCGGGEITANGCEWAGFEKGCRIPVSGASAEFGECVFRGCGAGIESPEQSRVAVTDCTIHSSYGGILGNGETTIEGGRIEIDSGEGIGIMCEKDQGVVHVGNCAVKSAGFGVFAQGSLSVAGGSIDSSKLAILIQGKASIENCGIHSSGVGVSVDGTAKLKDCPIKARSVCVMVGTQPSEDGEYPSRSAEIRGCRLEDAMKGVVIGINSSGIAEDCEIRNCSNAGIEIGSRDFSVIDCLLEKNGFGVYTHRSAALIQGNRILNNAKDGLVVRGDSNNAPRIIDNDCSHNEGTGIGVEAACVPGEFRGNRAEGNGVADIERNGKYPD